MPALAGGIDFALEAFEHVEHLREAGLGCGLGRLRRALAAAAQQQNLLVLATLASSSRTKRGLRIRLVPVAQATCLMPGPSGTWPTNLRSSAERTSTSTACSACTSAHASLGGTLPA